MSIDYRITDFFKTAQSDGYNAAWKQDLDETLKRHPTLDRLVYNIKIFAALGQVLSGRYSFSSELYTFLQYGPPLRSSSRNAYSSKVENVPADVQAKQILGNYASGINDSKQAGNPADTYHSNIFSQMRTETALIQPIDVPDSINRGKTNLDHVARYESEIMARDSSRDYPAEKKEFDPSSKNGVRDFGGTDYAIMKGIHFNIHFKQRQPIAFITKGMVDETLPSKEGYKIPNYFEFKESGLMKCFDINPVRKN